MPVRYTVPGTYVAICYTVKRDAHQVIVFEFPSIEDRVARRMEPLRQANENATLLPELEEAFRRHVSYEDAHKWFITVVQPTARDRVIVVLPMTELVLG